VIVAVLDTNVLVSGFPAPTGVPGTLIDLWRRGVYLLVVSEPILMELAETWRDPYWAARFPSDESKAAIDLLRDMALVTPLTVEVAGVATHPEDDLILATAVSGGADYLVTGDRKVLAIGAFGNVTIFSPRAFLTRLAEDA
jgi:putative PIN family toxin of toxin-antitoxin system